MKPLERKGGMKTIANKPISHSTFALNRSVAIGSKDFPMNVPIRMPREMDAIQADVVFCLFKTSVEALKLLDDLKNCQVKKTVLVSQVDGSEMKCLNDILNQNIDGLITMRELEQNYVEIIKMLDQDQDVYSYCFLKNMAEKIIIWKLLPEKLSHFELDEKAVGSKLNRTEKMVLQQIGNGYNTKTIADMKKYSESTIYIAVSSVIQALQAKDRTDAVVKAIQKEYLVPVSSSR